MVVVVVVVIVGVVVVVVAGVENVIHQTHPELDLGWLQSQIGKGELAQSDQHPS